MKAYSQAVCLLAIVSAVNAAQHADWSTRGGHAAAHSKDSFVLVFRRESIARGPDYSMRASALEYQKKKHLRDLVWFSTGAGCFMSNDPKVVASLKETEKPQKELGDQEARVGGSDLKLARQLSLEQDRLTWQRDEIVWSLFDRLQKEGRLTAVKENCPSR